MTKPEDVPSQARSRPGLGWVFTGLLLAIFLASLDQTIVATALPTVAGELHGLDHLYWVVAAYLLAATATTPLWGKISDLYSRKRIFQAAIVVFLVGSALCGASATLGQLVGFRALQGVGAGGLMALAMAIVADVVPPRDRGRYQGIIQSVFAIASVAGPLIGGALVDHAGWRWIFYVNLPVGVLALAVTSIALDLPARPAERHIDFLGSALMMAGVVALLLATTYGGNQYSWRSAQLISLLAAGVLLLATFAFWETRAREPVLPLRLFRDRVFSVVSMTLFIASCSVFAALVFLPLFLQMVTGASATESGLLLLPLVIGIAITATGSGWVISALGRYKIFPVAGFALSAAGLGLMSLLTPSSGRAESSLYMTVFGLGFGMVTQVLIIAL